MRKSIIIVVLLLAVAVPVAIAAAVSSDNNNGSSEKARTARLAPLGIQPLRIRGQSFVPGERVAITVKIVLGKTMKRQTTAGRRGGFIVNFGDANTCNGFSARATGDRGSRASISFQYSSFVCKQ